MSSHSLVSQPLNQRHYQGGAKGGTLDLALQESCVWHSVDTMDAAHLILDHILDSFGGWRSRRSFSVSSMVMFELYQLVNKHISTIQESPKEEKERPPRIAC